MSYRDPGGLLDEDRKLILVKNRSQLKTTINIQSGELLEHLVKQNVITEPDKDMIMVM